MNKRSIITIDLAKDVFELAIANKQYRIIQRQRLNRARFEGFMQQQSGCVIVMEACGTAHYWGRLFQQNGHEVFLLPPQYVRPYRRRNKTDRADCEALLEAYRCEGLKPVPIKTVEQLELQQLHRLREQQKKNLLARTNFLRGLFREQGISLPKGHKAALSQVRESLDQLSVSSLKMTQWVLQDVQLLKEHMEEIEQEIHRLGQRQPVIRRLQTIPGIGELTSTALVAAIGKVDHFHSGRQLAAWLGITPRESSSGHRRYLGSITKQGSPYLRTLLIHGARSVLASTKHRFQQGKPLTRLQQWAHQLEQRIGHNKATVALANKLARVAWACWKREQDYQQESPIMT